MKWIVILLIGAVGAWAYFNFSPDLTGAKNNATDTIKQEKTMKKFFGADEQNKQETQKVLENF
jgi:hypothetical protein